MQINDRAEFRKSDPPEQLELFDSATPLAPAPASTIFDGYLKLQLKILAQQEPEPGGALAP